MTNPLAQENHPLLEPKGSRSAWRRRLAIATVLIALNFGGLHAFYAAATAPRLAKELVAIPNLLKYPSIAKFERMLPGVLDFEALIQSANVAVYENARKAFSENTFGMYEAEKHRAIEAGFCLDENFHESPSERPSAEAPVSKVEYVDGKPRIAIMASKELGGDIEAYIPWAYYLHLHGCDYYTRSFPGLDTFFWFSKNHTSNIALTPYIADRIGHWEILPDFCPWYPLEEGLPGGSSPTDKDIHPPGGLIWPPYKSFFRGRLTDEEMALGEKQEKKKSDKQLRWSSYHDPIFRKLKPSPDQVFQEPTPLKIAVLTGKHTTEFGTGPLNTFANPELLEPLLKLLVNAGYVVLYNRPLEINAKSDSRQKVLSIGDYQFIEANCSDLPVFSLPEFVDFAVANAQERLVLPPAGNDDSESDDKLTNARNIVQMSIYATADYFVSTQGGNAALASLFAEKQFIYHRFGQEQLFPVKHFPTSNNFVYKHWWKHNGAWIYADRNFASLLRHVWVDLVESTGLDIPIPPNKNYEKNATPLPWKDQRWRNWYKPPQ